MKRILSVLLCITMLLVTALSVCAAPVDTAAAGDNTVCIYVYLSPDDAEYTNGVEYTKGDIPSRPPEPSKEGMTFIDWYTNKALTYRFDFSKPLLEDTNLYARFVPTDDAIGVNVFASPDADYPLYGYLCAKGDLMEYPPSPEYGEDEEFLGWYSDRELTKRVDFSQPIDDYTYLFPRILPLSALCNGWLYLDADAEDPTVGFSVPKGECCPVPEDPGKDDMVFEGWYSDRSLKKSFDFTEPVYEDFALFPKYTPIHHHSLQMVETVYATAVADGLKAHYVCTECGKWFEPIETALIEIHNHDSLIIPARGPYLLGDVDGNGKVEVVDSTVIQRLQAKMTISGSLCRGAADVDGNNETDIIDATWIQRYLSHITVPYLIGTTAIPINS